MKKLVTIVITIANLVECKDIQPALGIYTNLVIPIRWADTTVVLPTWGEYQGLFNQVEYIYNVTSLGKFTVKSSVMDWYNSSRNSFDVSNGDYALGCCLVQQAIREAVLDQMVDPSLFDLVTFVHSGYAAEWGDIDSNNNVPQYRIWSQQTNFVYPIGHWKTYVIASGLWGINGSEIAHPGIFAHEILHNFGLLDLYDTKTDGYNFGVGLGCFSLMADSWGCDYTQHPPMLDPYYRIKMGWIDPIEITTSGNYSITDSQTTGNIYKISKNYFDGEYLLIENRNSGGIETNLVGSGILVYHIDEATTYLDRQSVPRTLPICQSSTICDTWPWNHYRIALLQADGLYELETTNTYGNLGDFYKPGMILGPNTVPNTNTYQNGIVRDTKLTILFGTNSFQVNWFGDSTTTVAPSSTVVPTSTVTPQPPPQPVTPPPVIKPSVTTSLKPTPTTSATPSNVVKQVVVSFKFVNKLYNMTVYMQIQNPTKKTYTGQFRRVLNKKIVWIENTTSSIIKNGIVYFNSRLRQKVKGVGYQFCYASTCLPVR